MTLLPTPTGEELAQAEKEIREEYITPCRHLESIS